MLAACGSRPPATPPAAVVTGRPIVLITIDTLRADRLGSYGSTRGLTPALDRFAQDAHRFTAAITQVPITLPAHATILTGLHPARHGVRTNDGFRLAPAVATLAEAVRGRGYATGAFIGGYPLQASSGLSRGFDRYDDEFLKKPGAIERPADAVVDAALGWIEPHRTQPFFVWLHLSIRIHRIRRRRRVRCRARRRAVRRRGRLHRRRHRTVLRSSAPARPLRSIGGRRRRRSRRVARRARRAHARHVSLRRDDPRAAAHQTGGRDGFTHDRRPGRNVGPRADDGGDGRHGAGRCRRTERAAAHDW